MPPIDVQKAQIQIPTRREVLKKGPNATWHQNCHLFGVVFGPFVVKCLQDFGPARIQAPEMGTSRKALSRLSRVPNRTNGQMSQMWSNVTRLWTKCVPNAYQKQDGVTNVHKMATNTRSLAHVNNSCGKRLSRVPDLDPLV